MSAKLVLAVAFLAGSAAGFAYVVWPGEPAKGDSQPAAPVQLAPPAPQPAPPVVQQQGPAGWYFVNFEGRDYPLTPSAGGMHITITGTAVNPATRIRWQFSRLGSELYILATDQTGNTIAAGFAQNVPYYQGPILLTGNIGLTTPAGVGAGPAPFAVHN